MRRRRAARSPGRLRSSRSEVCPGPPIGQVEVAVFVDDDEVMNQVDAVAELRESVRGPIGERPLQRQRAEQDRSHQSGPRKRGSERRQRVEASQAAGDGAAQSLPRLPVGVGEARVGTTISGSACSMRRVAARAARARAPPGSPRRRSSRARTRRPTPAADRWRSGSRPSPERSRRNGAIADAGGSRASFLAIVTAPRARPGRRMADVGSRDQHQDDVSPAMLVIVQCSGRWRRMPTGMRRVEAGAPASAGSRLAATSLAVGAPIPDGGMRAPPAT